MSFELADVRKSLRAKLLAGFLTGAVLALGVGVVGLTGLVQVGNRVDGLVDESIPKVAALAVVENELNGLMAIVHAESNPELSREGREGNAAHLDEHREKYREALDEYETRASAAEHELLADFVARVKVWAAVNDSIFAESGRLVEMDLVDPAGLQNKVSVAEIEHLRATNAIQSAIDRVGRVNTATLERRCKLSVGAAYFETDSPAFVALRDDLFAAHDEYHAAAEAIDEALAAEDVAAARRLLNQQLMPSMQSVTASLEDMRGLCEEAFGHLRVMNHLTTTESVPRQEDAFEVLHAMHDLSMEETGSTAQSAAGVVTSASTAIVFGALVAVGLAVLLGFVVSRRIVNPVHDLVTAFTAMSQGDLRQRIQSDSIDEIGTLARSFNDFSSAIAEAMGQIAQGSKSVRSSSEDLNRVSGELLSVADAATSSSEAAKQSMDHTAESVQSISAGSEEMAASIQEISSNTTKAADVARSAVGITEQTLAETETLGARSAEIGEVVRVITSIAEQTNLLALNATIEAARAGAAGKGFAVVAEEVKALAQQTSEATESIAGRIEGIQQSTRDTVASIDQVTTVIGEIESITTSIAGAVEEQSATTSEIARSASEAYRSSSELQGSVDASNQALGRTKEGADRAKGMAQDLSALSAQLESSVGRFKF